MPFYEFECQKGHVIERLVPIGTTEVVCVECTTIDERTQTIRFPMATRILSPTPTTFVCAGGRKL